MSRILDSDIIDKHEKQGLSANTKLSFTWNGSSGQLLINDGEEETKNEASCLWEDKSTGMSLWFLHSRKKQMFFWSLSSSIMALITHLFKANPCPIVPPLHEHEVRRILLQLKSLSSSSSQLLGEQSSEHLRHFLLETPSWNISIYCIFIFLPWHQCSSSAIRGDTGVLMRWRDKALVVGSIYIHMRRFG